MSGADNTRMAYIAREPGTPGAVGYINAQTIPAGIVQSAIENWMACGCTIEKVSIAQAMRELSLYATARRNRPLESSVVLGLGADTPMMLRPQAD